MIHQEEISLPAFPRGFHIIDRYIANAISNWPKQGLCHLFIRHTSAGLAINEGADPDVRSDLEKIFDRLVPEDQPYYEHTSEGPDDMPAHGKSILSGCSLSIPIRDGRLALGTWQSIYLCEYRSHAGSRRIIITIYS